MQPEAMTPREDVFQRLGAQGIVPVATLPEAGAGAPLMEALLEAGLPCVEITFRTAHAAQALEAIARDCPGALPGAGTVLTVDQARTAVDAGARFLVSPGLNPKVVAWALERDVPIIPGVATPSEVERGLELGLSVLKLFPAEALGGLDYLTALLGPYRGVRFMPTGGIHPGNLEAYLACPQVLACGGTWMVKPEWIQAGSFATIRQAAQAALALAHRARPLQEA